MKDGYAQIREAGGDVLALSFGPPEGAAAFLRHTSLPFPLVADPARTAYQAFGLEKAALGTFFRAAVLGRFVRMLLRGWLPRLSGKGEDVFQLGGDFLLGKEERLTYAHRSADATDRPSLAELLRALRQAQGTPR